MNTDPKMDALLDSVNSLSESCLLGQCGGCKQPRFKATSATNSLQSCEKLNQEQTLFSNFLPKLKSNKDGSKSNKVDTTKLSKLFKLVVEKRVFVVGFMQGMRHGHVHVVLCFVRLALKEKKVVEDCKQIINEKFAEHLIRLGEIYSDLYIDSAFQSQKMFDLLLIEVMTILSRITCNPTLSSVVVQSAPNLSSLLGLCSSVIAPSNKTSLVQCSLQFLLDCLTVEPSLLSAVYEQILNCDAFNILGQLAEMLSQPKAIVDEYDTFSNMKLAAEVILVLCEMPNCEERIDLIKVFMQLDILPVLVANIRLDSDSDLDLSLTCCSAVARMCYFSPEIVHTSIVKRENTVRSEIVSHLVQFVLAHIQIAEDDSSNLEREKRVLSCLAGVCSVFSNVCRLSELNEKIFTEANGIFAMGQVTFILPVARSTSASGAKDEMIKLVSYSLMTLRLLFSSKEKMRSLIRKFFPVELCQKFAECGNHQLNLKNYTSLASEIVNRSLKGELNTEDISNKLVEINLEAPKLEGEQKIIGKYVIIDELGDGSFGSVMRVRKKQEYGNGSSGSCYALKKIIFSGKEAASKKKAMASTIMNEIKILKEQLNHPNLVRYLKTFRENETLYVLMELADGISLQEHLDYIESSKCGPIQEERVWNIAIQFIQGLKYLHVDKELIHRDLSPNNILLTFEDVVKITDFGFTKATDKNGMCRSVVGTVSYWCPEITQEQPYDNKADIWAYGCIVYQMCTLKPPFIADNILSIAKKIVECNYQPIDARLPYSDLMRLLVAKCITVEKELRPDALGVVQILSPKLLEQLDIQADKLKQCRRRNEMLRQRLDSVSKTWKLNSSRPSSNTLELSLGSHGDLQSGNLTPSPAAEVTMDLLGSSGGLSFPTASHSRASSATSLNSVAEEPMSNNGHNTRSNGHGSGNPPRINSPVSNNFESSQPNTAALARALKSTRSPSSISTSSSNNKSFTVTLPMSKLRELKVASLSPSGKRGSIGGRDLSSNDSQVDMLQFLRRLDSLCNRKKDNLTKKESKQLYLVSLVRKKLYSCDDSEWMRTQIRKFLEESGDVMHINFFQNPAANECFGQNFAHLAVNCIGSNHSQMSYYSKSQSSMESVSYQEFMKIVNSL
ncbi:serine/threonine-protein kinase D1044.8-like isoform X2 [Symsagittifera roscoffensis]|uniref:serine/threonine-protein kinase D1044.8-like isoform X2 n=1 Tax=Symsagittifera roscoffensis TaxID=84072 RepID=UPI00307C5FC2